ncbi:MAG: plasmid pRiA4b ORF-3 family protein [Sphaerochaeta sp.]|jgi:hypothetical protein|uniref:plasmid pRiA4b ORF-3 family protein n=1 Tax=Sphaerochaeta sp. TaxID=1972642 RepID=UPI003D0EB19D
MQIGCTKKLLDYLRIQAGAADTAIDPLFSWSANMIMVNHRRTIVVSNDASRYAFILYGINRDDVKNIETLILEGVRACLDTMCFTPTIIDQYLQDCGEGITFSKTANRSVVAGLNNVCARTHFFFDRYSTEVLLQKQMIRHLNMDYLTVKTIDGSDYVNISEKFSSDIERKYGQPLFRCKAAVFDIDLELDSTCRRRVVVPLNCTFREFHDILQTLLGWWNHHLHDFWIERHPNGRLKYTLTGFPREFEEEGETTKDDSLVFLHEIFPQYREIIYNYDFGDFWIAHIRLHEIIDDYDKNHPVCLDWEGEAPPEDVGGRYGYAELLRILSNPEDPEYKGMMEWYRGSHHQLFDLEHVNRRLRFW